MRFFKFFGRSQTPSSPVPDFDQCTALFDGLAEVRTGEDWDNEQRQADFRTVFLGSPAGKRVLHEILAWSRLFASTFVPGDAHATHWREGGRDVGLRILAILNAGPPLTPPGSGQREGMQDEEGAQP